MSPAAAAAVTSLKKPGGATGNDLTQAAIAAVARLAQATGHPLGAAPGNAPAGGGNKAILVVVLALPAIATATALLVLRYRQALTRRR